MKSNLQSFQSKPDRTPTRFFGVNGIIYMLKRFFRLYPVFIFSILGYIFLYKTETQSKKLTNSTVLFAQNFFEWLTPMVFDNHFWTMPLELNFFFIALPIVSIVASECIILDFKFLESYKIKSVYFAYAVFTAMAIEINYDNDFLNHGWEQRMHPTVHYPVFWYRCMGGVVSYYVSYYQIKIPSIHTRERNIIAQTLQWIILIRCFFGNQKIAAVYLNITEPNQFQSQTLLAPFYSALFLLLDLTNS
jgi:peptidoglycan/LPS O-acetylase OafA/YrhL